ncbi:MAG: SNARE associated Golgi protein [Promethearchaeota archaeon]|nr:MAG: SNARE associated Golgi protein [Candidatus Lokiarchaeota archaeon]
MAASKRLNILFLLLFVFTFIYLVCIVLFPEFQKLIIDAREFFTIFIYETNYFIALIFVLIVCLIGNLSFGFPIPYPFILFQISNSIYQNYSHLNIFTGPFTLIYPFWLQILGLTLAGGLGSACGEILSYIIGWKAKSIVGKKQSQVIRNIEGFGKLVLKNPKRSYFYIFLFAALPLPDDPLWASIGFTVKNEDNYKFSFISSIIAAWMGKNLTTLFYCMLPILIALGLANAGIEIDDTSSIITEAIFLLFTIFLMYMIMAFNWERFLEEKGNEMINFNSK